MAEHSVSLAIPDQIQIGNTDIKIRIWKDGDRFGTLTLSKGGIDWRPRNAKAGKSGETRLGWTEFDAQMKEANKNKR